MTLTWTPRGGNTGEFEAVGLDVCGTVYHYTTKLNYVDRTYWVLIWPGPPGSVPALDGPNFPTAGEALNWCAELTPETLSAYLQDHVDD
jgi:hypothetical protein